VRERLTERKRIEMKLLGSKPGIRKKDGSFLTAI
jgi:hypothetical protein